MTTAATAEKTFQGPACTEHRNLPAEWKCTRCGHGFCEICMTEASGGRKVSGTCPRCRGFCRKVEMRSVIGPASFGDIVAEAISCPLQGQGVLVIMLGVVFFMVLDALSTVPIFGVFWAIFGAGYLSAYILKLLNHSAMGEKELPGWPEFTNIQDSILIPFVHLLVTSVFCFVPAVGALLTIGFNTAGGVAFLVLVGAGCIYFPMALLSVALNNSLAGLNPLLVVAGIRAVPGPYLLTCFFLAIFGAASGFCQTVVERSFPFVGSATAGFISLLALIIEMRLLGSIYHAYEDRFPWFKA